MNIHIKELTVLSDAIKSLQSSIAAGNLCTDILKDRLEAIEWKVKSILTDKGNATETYPKYQTSKSHGGNAILLDENIFEVFGEHQLRINPRNGKQFLLSPWDTKILRDFLNQEVK